MSYEDYRKTGVRFGFIPNRLEIKDRPELKAFPLNVLFMKSSIRDGKLISGSALYEPDLLTYSKKGDILSLDYENKYGGRNWLEIKYNATKKSYSAKKIVNCKLIGIAEAPEWQKFFIQLTLLGLSNGERCKFSYPESKQ